MRRRDGANRVVLGLLGVVLLAAGAAGLARSYGYLGAGATGEAVLDEELREAAADAGWVLPAVVALVAVGVAYLAWRWLRAQVRKAPALSDAELPATEPDEPSTRVRAGTILDAVTADVKRHRDVVDAGGRLGPEAEPFTLHLEVTVADGGRLEEVRDHVDRVVVPRLRQAVEVDALDARLHFRTAPRRRAA